MNKYSLLVIILSLIIISMFSTIISANQSILEIEKNLENVNGKEKIDALNRLAAMYFSKDIQKSINYGEQALKLSKQINNIEGESASLISLGVANSIRGNHQKALEFFFMAQKILEESGNDKFLARCYGNIGIVYKSMGSYEKSLEYHLKSLEIKEKMEDKKGVAFSYSNIGLLYLTLKEYEKSLDFLFKALDLRKEQNDKSGLSADLNNIGAVYQEKKDYPNAIVYHLQSLSIKNELGDEGGMAYSLANIGNMYFKLNNYNTALDYYLKSLKQFEKMGDKNAYAEALNCTGEVLIKLKKYADAELYLMRGLQIASEMQTKGISMSIYYTLFTLNEIQSKYKKALEYHVLFQKTDKEIFNEKSSKQINELQEKFSAEKREKDIALLKKNEEIQILKIKKERATRNVFIIGLLFVFTILMLLFYKYLYLFAFWKKHAYVGQYRLMKKIGSGGFGTVYKAHNIRDKTHTVALKILNEDIIDEANLRRFVKESEYIEKLSHPNIVKVYERGVDSKSNAKYIAMEFLEGRSLGDIMQENGNKLSLPDSLHIIIQITDALVQIHGKGIIHRDIKPGNIMIIEQNGDCYFVKLLDFGIAINNYETRLTKTGNFMGSENYVAPEQIKENKAMAPSLKSDIFSLGILFYELLTGKRPEDMNYRIMNDLALDDFISADTVLPDSLVNLIKAMLQKDPQIRPETAIVLRELHDISAVIK